MGSEENENNLANRFKCVNLWIDENKYIEVVFGILVFIISPIFVFVLKIYVPSAPQPSPTFLWGIKVMIFVAAYCFVDFLIIVFWCFVVHWFHRFLKSGLDFNCLSRESYDQCDCKFCAANSQSGDGLAHGGARSVDVVNNQHVPTPN